MFLFIMQFESICVPISTLAQKAIAFFSGRKVRVPPSPKVPVRLTIKKKFLRVPFSIKVHIERKLDKFSLQFKYD